MKSGLLPSNIGYSATIANPPKGNPIKKRHMYLDKVHMDIVFGDCVALGGYRYSLVLVDMATRYCWICRIYPISSTSTTSALEQSKADVGCLPHQFHSDFDRKLIGGNSIRWIILNGSNITTAPTGRQYWNGLVECTWRTLIKMARELITDKQVRRKY